MNQRVNSDDFIHIIDALVEASGIAFFFGRPTLKP